MRKPIKILLVEDEAYTALSLAGELRESGYDMLEPAASGEEAVLMDEKENPDIIFMDIRLAGEMDGVEAARRIRARRDVPIVYMTGYAGGGGEKTAGEPNPAAYLVKPVQMSHLNEVIRSIFGNDGAAPRTRP